MDPVKKIRGTQVAQLSDGGGRQGELQIDQDLDFQRRSWKVQRIGWGVMLLLAIAGLLGLFGSGPLSRRTAGRPGDPIRLEYHFFERAHAPMKLQIHLGPQNGAERGAAGSVALWLSRDYLDRLEIKQISPEPERVIAGPDRLTYHFRVDDPEGTVVTFRAEPDQAGPLSGRVGLPGREPLSFSQFIYP